MLAEYKSFLNMGCHSDQVDYFNIELELLRQLEVPREEVNRIVESSFLRLMEGKLPLENKVMLVGSVVRIVWSAMLNPEYCLNVLNENQAVLNSLQPMARYRVYKELALLFNDLHGELTDQYGTLRDNVNDYMANRAEGDIRQYRKSLPEEAIFARCECLKELAGIHKARLEYDSQLILSFLTDAIELYRDNSLHIDAVKCREHCCYLSESTCHKSALSKFLGEFQAIHLRYRNYRDAWFLLFVYLAYRSAIW